jgi:nickel-type superoxide dismutase maturation protease
MDPPPPTWGESEPYHRPRRPLAALSAAATVGAIALALFRWRPTRVEIQGASMEPTLLPGDWALAVAQRRTGRGDVVVVEHPGRPGYEMVKRVTALPGERVGERTLEDDEYWIEGDREDASTDSRHFGPVRREHLKARVLLVYWPKERRRRISGERVRNPSRNDG